MSGPAERRPDPLARALDWGLALFVILAPLPFAAVTNPGRLALELSALGLLLLWLLRAVSRPTPLPPRAVRVAVVGLLAVGALQALPLGAAVVDLVSPRAAAIHADLRPDETLRRAESELLGTNVDEMDRAPTLSLDPAATASALRTGSALAALLLVTVTVVRIRGARLLATALLVSASFQALYGILVLASGHDRIWNVAKRYYLDSATGTFVNRNHFAGFVAACACCGLALVLERARRADGERSRRVLVLLGPEGSRTLLLALMVVLALAGLLLSFSRAGIALGLTAVGATVLVAARFRASARVALIAALLVAAAVPLSQVGSERLAERYSQSFDDFRAPGGRGSVWADTLRMAGAFPVSGTGFGTFVAAYPRHRSPEVRLLFKNAHNDALQFTAEGGLLALALLVPLLAPLGVHTWGALRRRKGRLAVGFAAGLLALLVHSLMDFHFHIPSNAATIAVLAGAVLGLPWNRPR